MQYELKASHYNGEWVVEVIDPEGDGEVSVTTFSGPGAKERAAEYAAWKQTSTRQTAAA
ncbi:MAG: hypothetical protein ABI988_18565 [Nitrospirota bacterium]